MLSLCRQLCSECTEIHLQHPLVRLKCVIARTHELCGDISGS